MSNLLDEVNDGLADNDLWFLWNTTVSIVENDIISEHRWYDRRRVVLNRNDEFVAVEYNEGSTEMQEDTEPEGKAYAVRPIEVTVTKYEVVN